MLSRFHLIPERNGRTDGQICYISIARQYILTRDKNSKLSTVPTCQVKRIHTVNDRRCVADLDGVLAEAAAGDDVAVERLQVAVAEDVQKDRSCA